MEPLVYIVGAWLFGRMLDEIASGKPAVTNPTLPPAATATPTGKAVADISTAEDLAHLYAKLVAGQPEFGMRPNPNNHDNPAVDGPVSSGAFGGGGDTSGEWRGFSKLDGRKISDFPDPNRVWWEYQGVAGGLSWGPIYNTPMQKWHPVDTEYYAYDVTSYPVGGHIKPIVSLQWAINYCRLYVAMKAQDRGRKLTDAEKENLFIEAWKNDLFLDGRHAKDYRYPVGPRIIPDLKVSDL